MRLSKRVVFLLIVVIGLTIYLIWSAVDRKPRKAALEAEENRIIMSTNSRDVAGRSYIIMQPWLTPKDYQSREGFYSKLDSYLRQAHNEGLIDESTLVVFPEHIGTFLFLLNEKWSVIEAKSVEKALKLMAVSNIGKFLFNIPTAQGENVWGDVLLRMKSGEMNAAYFDTFSSLAREYSVTIVAGSIILPNPRVKNGRIKISHGDLYHIACLFHSDGTLAKDFGRKARLGEEEARLVAAGSVYAAPTFDTPMGPSAILFGADSWNHEIFRLLKEKGARAIAVPAVYSMEDWKLLSFLKDQPAANDSGSEAAIVKTVTPEVFWRASAVQNRRKIANAEVLMVSFLNGQFWGNAIRGRSIVVAKTGVTQAPAGDASVILNAKF